MYKINFISKSRKIIFESLKTNSSSIKNTLKNVSIEPMYLVDTVYDMSSIEDNLRVYSGKAALSLFKRARNTLLDRFSNVVIDNKSIKAGQNPLAYSITFCERLSIINKTSRDR